MADDPYRPTHCAGCKRELIFDFTVNKLYCPNRYCTEFEKRVLWLRPIQVRNFRTGEITEL